MSEENGVVAMEVAASRAHVNEVGYADGELKIKYQVAMDSGHGHEATVKCREAPTPDFMEALSHLKRHAVKIMDWEDDILGKWARTVQIVGLSVAYKKGVQYARFSMRKKLESGMISEIKTPFMRVHSPHPNIVQLGEEAKSDIEIMLRQAQLYIAGARAQTALFDEDGEDAA